MPDATQKIINLLGVPATANFIDLGEHNIHYIKAGSGRPLLLLHGINFGWGQWYKTIPALAAHFTVYALDFPGAGNSSRINFTDTEIGELYPGLIKQFITTLGLEKPYIVGHSIGAWAGLKLAMENSGMAPGKLALVNPLGFSRYLVWKQRPLVFKAAARLLSKTAVSPTKNNITNFLRGVFLDPKKLPAELADYYHESISRPPVSHPFLLINQLLKPFRIDQKFVLTDHLHSVLIPTAIFASENDPLLPLKKNQPNFQKIPNQTTYIIPDSGHVIPVENPTYFNQQLVNFLLS